MTLGRHKVYENVQENCQAQGQGQREKSKVDPKERYVIGWPTTNRPISNFLGAVHWYLG